MWEDPIVQEVHETRARILARFGGDFHAYVKYIEGVQTEKKKRGVQYASPPPRRPIGWEPKPHAQTDAAD
jgi:hypothetical protein